MTKAYRLTEAQRTILKLLVTHQKDWYKRLYRTNRSEAGGVSGVAKAIYNTLGVLHHRGLVRWVCRAEMIGWTVTDKGRKAMEAEHE